MQMGIYLGLIILISLLLFSSYICFHHASQVEQSIVQCSDRSSRNNLHSFVFLLIERKTVTRMRRVQTWLRSKPSMWIHNLAAAEKVIFMQLIMTLMFYFLFCIQIPLTVYDVNSGVTRTTLNPPVDIIECYVPMMSEQKRYGFNRPSLPPPPPPPPPMSNRMPFCNDDQSDQIYETPDPISWHIDV